MLILFSSFVVAFAHVVTDEWKPQDILAAAVGIVVALLTAILVLPVIREWRERGKFSDFGGECFLDEDIADATRCYVKPDCSKVDLNQLHEVADDGLRTHFDTESRLDLFGEVDNFCAWGSTRRHMLLLADSGMGKTSFALNYYIFNSRRRRRKRHRIAVIPLGHPQAMIELQKISRKKETILILDAFDEDGEAWRDYRGRLDTLVRETAFFAEC